jgi:hypothetical protein
VTTALERSGAEGSVTTAAEALAAWRQANGRRPEDEARARVFWVALGPLKVPVPHPGQLRWHDLHHVVLGYGTDAIGEMEISAFELRTGVTTPMVLFLCLAGVALGLLVAPVRTARAWRGARGKRNLYGIPWAQLQSWPLASLRRHVEGASSRAFSAPPVAPAAP